MQQKTHCRNQLMKKYFVIFLTLLSILQIEVQAQVSSSPSIVIVGAGLSGLYQAFLLEKAGYQVTVLEAQHRLGGRILTERDRGAQDLYQELGATRLPDTHLRVQRLVNELGITLDEFLVNQDTAIYFFKGKRFLEGAHAQQQVSPDLMTFLEFSPKEIAMGFKKVKTYYPSLGIDLLKPFSDEAIFHQTLNHPQLAQLSQQSYQEFFQSQHASTGAQRLLEAINGSEFRQYSALLFLYQERHDQLWDRTFKIHGGNDVLTNTLAKHLTSTIHLNSTVEKVKWSSEKKQFFITYAHQGHSKNIQADYVFMSTSSHALKKIQFEPSLSEKKQQLIESTPMQQVARINLRTKERFWKKEGQSGLVVAYTDLPIERIWDMTATQEGTEGILTLYVQAQKATDLCSIKEEDYQHIVLQEVEKVLPSIRAQLLSMNRWCWKQADTIGGGWAIYHADNAHLLHHWWENEQSFNDRLYFIGDHTSPMVGWIEGALESSERATKSFLRHNQLVVHE
jgi:monoamine oxidase